MKWRRKLRKWLIKNFTYNIINDVEYVGVRCDLCGALGPRDFDGPIEHKKGCWIRRLQ